MRQDETGKPLDDGRAAMNDATVAIYFRMFGPYQMARIAAAAAHLTIIGIEGSRLSSVYPWHPREDMTGFTRETLFADYNVDDQTPRMIISALRRALDRHDPDVVCVTGWSHTEALTMIAWARERRRRIVLFSESTRNDASRHGWREAIKARIVALSDTALVGGRRQQAYAALLGLPAERIFIGYDVVDNAHFAQGAAAARLNDVAVRAQLGLPRAYFLASARFIDKKNLARLIEAYALYRSAAGQPGWSLVILGDGPLRASLGLLADALGVAGSVLFAGFRQYDELPAYYALANCFVHVSTVEQWGLVVNEAMAAGLPVIVSRLCGCADDLVDDGVNGWLVDPFDPVAIAARMTDAASFKADRGAMAARGRTIIAEFDPARFGAGLADAVNLASALPPRRAGLVARLLLGGLARRHTRDAG